MSKLKKLTAGVLAAALCVTSIMAPAPKKAEAATYCSHTIYYAGREIVGSINNLEPHTHYVYINAGQFDGVPGEYYPVFCSYTVYLAKDVYKCYKCNYSYYGSTTYYSEPICSR